MILMAYQIVAETVKLASFAPEYTCAIVIGSKQGILCTTT